MRKEEIEEAAKLLSEIKDSIAELESAMKKNDNNKLKTIKGKLIGLQMQIDKKI